MKKVLILGTIPPPVGGVSIHIQRFYDKYKNSKKISIKLLDLKKDKSIIKLIKNIYKSDIVHIHLSNNLKIIIALLSKTLNKKVIYTHHNIRVKNLFFFKILMFFVDSLILVNDRDIDKRIKDKYSYCLIPAFIPSMDTTPLPEDLLKKIDMFDLIISTNCFELTFIDNQDLYGFDLIIKAFSKLVKEKKLKDTLLILVDPSATSDKYVDELISLHLHKCNGCDILYVNYPINFNELIKRSDILLRATRSDGDSLTVRESLYYGKSIIASDITIRPKGTVLFKSGDIDSFASTIVETLSNRVSVEDIKSNFSNDIIQLYQ